MIYFSFACVFFAAWIYFSIEASGPYYNHLVVGSQAFLFTMSTIALYFQPGILILFSIFFFSEILLGDNSANVSPIGRIKEGREISQRNWQSRIERGCRDW